MSEEQQQQTRRRDEKLVNELSEMLKNFFTINENTFDEWKTQFDAKMMEFKQSLNENPKPE
jgi:hypothetical protein